jgi:gamma-glutamyltranspeptidase/glutathione hydrolase
MSALVAGGSAVDAAVAASFALCVVDPMECGLGGYGGFLTYAPPGGAPVCVDFNTWVPDQFDVFSFRLPGDDAEPSEGGRSVAPPMVVPGLVRAHERFGRLPLAEVVAPAVRLAREGFPVGHGLAQTLARQWERTGGGRPELARIFYRDGKPPAAGTRLVQSDLAATLEAIASLGAAPFKTGALVEAICVALAADGGLLEPPDFVHESVVVGLANRVTFESSTVYGPSRATSGAGVFFTALAAVDAGRLGANRSRSYVEELRRALACAWHERTVAARAALNAHHTTSLCASDADGGLAAVSFSLGWRPFGSGIVPPATGVVLNGGANLFAAAAGGPLVVSNMSPIVIEMEDGVRHALAASGGPRIPGILLTNVVDVAHYGSTLSAALAAPRLTVNPLDGTLEAEAGLLEFAGGSSAGTNRAFTATSGITWASGRSIVGVDPRVVGLAAT